MVPASIPGEIVGTWARGWDKEDIDYYLTIFDDASYLLVAETTTIDFGVVSVAGDIITFHSENGQDLGSHHWSVSSWDAYGYTTYNLNLGDNAWVLS